LIFDRPLLGFLINAVMIAAGFGQRWLLAWEEARRLFDADSTSTVVRH
jgi:hypothetical protein